MKKEKKNERKKEKNLHIKNLKTKLIYARLHAYLVREIYVMKHEFN